MQRSPDDADPPRAGLAQDVAEQVASRRQVRARIVERDARRVLGHDPAHVEQERVRGELRHLLDEPAGVECRVDLAHVGLDESHGLVHPPARRRPGPGAPAGQDQDQGESEGKSAAHEPAVGRFSMVAIRAHRGLARSGRKIVKRR
jgi:hypothetical protein